jgi:hypothetical protein
MLRTGDSHNPVLYVAKCPETFRDPQFINKLPISAWTAHDPYIPYDQRLRQTPLKYSNTCHLITFEYFLHRLM